MFTAFQLFSFNIRFAGAKRKCAELSQAVLVNWQENQMQFFAN